MHAYVRNTLTAIAALSSATVFGCASCGCTLNSDWGAQGIANSTGWSLDIRYDMLNQNQLRSGTGPLSAFDAAHATNSATNSPAEVERFTNNQYVTSTLDYRHENGWGVSLILPYIKRTHSTFGTGSPDGVTPGDGSYDSSASGIGDARLMGRYDGFTEGKNFGVQLGLKFATGQASQIADDGVTPVDPGLQLGTGTTDAIVGAYYFDNLNQDWDYFLLAQFQTALNSSSMNGMSFRPGDSLNLSGGLRYHGFEPITPTLQINARRVHTDSGDAADTFATGGTLVYITPGFMVAINPTLTLYSNLQIPVYQDVKGIQLAPTTLLSIGARLAF